MGGSQNQEMMQDIMGGAQIATGAAATAMGQPAVGVPLMAGGIQGVSNSGQPQGQGQSSNPMGMMNPQMLSQLMGGQQKPQQQQPPPMPPPRPPVTPQNMGQQMAAPKPNPAPPVPQMAQPPQNAQSMQAMIAKLLGGSS
jgi:hypothetical protein